MEGSGMPQASSFRLPVWSAAFLSGLLQCRIRKGGWMLACPVFLAGVKPSFPASRSEPAQLASLRLFQRTHYALVGHRTSSRRSPGATNQAPRCRPEDWDGLAYRRFLRTARHSSSSALPSPSLPRSAPVCQCGWGLG